jgi:hypothetical protein
MSGGKNVFRSHVTYGLDTSTDSRVDRESGLIRGISVISIGEAQGHDMDIDDETLNQVVSLGNSAKKGIKCRFGHPNMSQTALGTFLGCMTNFKRDGDRVRADLKIADSAHNTPNGDLGKYILDLAEQDPDKFGASIAFRGKAIQIKDEDGNVKKDEDGNELRPRARVEFLYSVDTVDEPATGDGFFSRSVKLSAEVTDQLNKFLDEPGCIDNGVSFLKRYVANGGNVGALEKISKMLSNYLSTNTEKEYGMEENNNETLQSINGTSETTNGVSSFSNEDIEKQAIEKERKRLFSINGLCERFGVKGDVKTKLVKEGFSVDDAIEYLTSLEDSNLANVNQKFQITADEKDKKLSAMTDGVLLNSGLNSAVKKKRAEEVRKSEYGNVGVQKLARICLEEAGVSNVHMMGSDELYKNIIKLSTGAYPQQTDDFTSVLSNTLRKSAGQGWNSAPTTYQAWTNTGSLSDFKTQKVVKLTNFSDVEIVPEGEARKFGKMADLYEEATLKTYGINAGLTRQAMINDDLDMLTRVPMRLMQSMRRYVNRYVYELIYGASFAGPTMNEDDGAMFQADSARGNNLVAAGSGGSITQETVNTGVSAMMKFPLPSPDNSRSNTERLNVPPKYLIFGPSERLNAYKLLNDVYYRDGTNDDNASDFASNMFGPNGPNSMVGVEEALIDYLDSSYYPWYLAADYNMVDTVTVFTLNGQDAPVVDSEPSRISEPDGIVWGILYDFTASAIDWRGMYCNSGASQ